VLTETLSLSRALRLSGNSGGPEERENRRVIAKPDVFCISGGAVSDTRTERGINTYGKHQTHIFANLSFLSEFRREEYLVRVLSTAVCVVCAAGVYSSTRDTISYGCHLYTHIFRMTVTVSRKRRLCDLDLLVFLKKIRFFRACLGFVQSAVTHTALCVTKKTYAVCVTLPHERRGEVEKWCDSRRRVCTVFPCIGGDCDQTL